MLEQRSFIDFWNTETAKLTRSKLKAAKMQQITRQVKSYAEVFAAESSDDEVESNNVRENVNEGSEYEAHESTPSSTSSNDGN